VTGKDGSRRAGFGVPTAFPNNPSVTLRIDFRGNDVGTFVFHCHILNHEDLGMVNIIQVVPATTSSTSKSTPSQAEGSGASKTAAPAKASKAATTSTVGTEKMKMD
jgi:hypothetical protein